MSDDADHHAHCDAMASYSCPIASPDRSDRHRVVSYMVDVCRWSRSCIIAAVIVVPKIVQADGHGRSVSTSLPNGIYVYRYMYHDFTLSRLAVSRLTLNDLYITNLRYIEPRSALFCLSTTSAAHKKSTMQSCRHSRSSKTPFQRVNVQVPHYQNQMCTAIADH